MPPVEPLHLGHLALRSLDCFWHGSSHIKRFVRTYVIVLAESLIEQETEVEESHELLKSEKEQQREVAKQLAAERREVEALKQKLEADMVSHSQRTRQLEIERRTFAELQQAASEQNESAEQSTSRQLSAAAIKSIEEEAAERERQQAKIEQQKAELRRQQQQLNEQMAAFEEMQKQFREETAAAGEIVFDPDEAPLGVPAKSDRRPLGPILLKICLVVTALAAGYGAVLLLQGLFD